MDERVLVCHRTIDLEEPKVRSIVERCDACGWSVWRALSSPSDIDRIVCLVCVADDLKRHPDAVVEPTAEQLEDIKRFLKAGEG